MRESLDAVARARLPEVVRAVLDEPSATLGPWGAAPLLGGARAYDAGQSLLLLSGVADVGENERPWRVVLKGVAPDAARDDQAAGDYWRREWLLYHSGLLAALPAGLRAPRCYASEEGADGTAWTWLEYVPEEGERTWSLARWALAARHLGRFNGACLVERWTPSTPWLGGGRLRAWLERHHAQVAQIAAAPRDPVIRRWWPEPVVDAILRLWDERAKFCDALDRLPQTFCHGDAIRRNLMSRRGASGSEETVAIDWEYAGLYALGEEVGQTVSVAGAFVGLSPADLPTLDEAIFASYLAGLRDAGWRGDPASVRFAYAAHAALRNAFNAVGASVPDAARRPEIRRNYGVTWEELAERRAAVRPFLLQLADEARDLMRTS